VDRRVGQGFKPTRRSQLKIRKFGGVDVRNVVVPIDERTLLLDQEQPYNFIVCVASQDTQASFGLPNCLLESSHSKPLASIPQLGNEFADGDVSAYAGLASVTVMW
jgi:hypothetical protein